MAAALPEDVILEILARLPPKYALQCSALNKSFFQAISCPYFARRNAALSSSPSSNSTILIRCSSRCPKIYTRLSLEIPRRHLPAATTILMHEVKVLDSCYGILLLRVKSSELHHVFNPITGGIVPVDHLSVHLNQGVGLVIDFLPDSSYGLKLATFYIHPTEKDRRGSLLKFSILVPYQDFTEIKSQVSLFCEGLTLVKDEHMKPVYAHGSVHWLANHGTKVIAFNVQKGKARIFDGPVKGGLRHLGYKWFGLAEGSLSYVYTPPGEIVVVAHDSSTDEWRVRYRINDLRVLSNRNYGKGMPLFFDGRRVVVRVGRRDGGDEVYEFEMGMNEKWEKRGVVEQWSDAFQHFFTFNPTLAKVSDNYLHNNPTHVREYHLIKGPLLQLQHLLRI
ncbi:putative F-box/kelch-repeat protein At1g20790 [Sesamum indicum]|uniref:F-box/kelch-repeat protein At1g20790 n=1 Tax=Sesamum indicum TaxID=4182 RepID=A0A6I9SVG1_SESIN|nr:putative F-box/kelch-repeat protein At1g20790 [Sesamum indicum]